jgi:HlyD family secretion protein
VVSAVTATGSVVSSSEQKLGFVAGGRVTQVLVRVGDRVDAGRPLARLDDDQLRRVLEQRQATLDAQQAVLGRVRADNSVPAADAALTQARRSREATEDEAAATDEANAVATERARAELRTDQDARDRAEDERRGCTAAAGCDPAAAESAVRQADSAVAAARTEVVAAEQQERVGKAAGEVSVENARQVVVSAQNERDAAAGDRRFDIAEQEGVVADARAGVAAARRDVDDAVLSSPVAGVVTAINGAPGEYLADASAVTAQAPGSTAAIPDPGSGGAPGAGAFIVLAAVGRSRWWCRSRRPTRPGSPSGSRSTSPSRPSPGRPGAGGCWPSRRALSRSTAW